ncbi:MAG: S8 family serine peptidase [Planctomycetota bacterium]
MTGDESLPPATLESSLENGEHAHARAILDQLLEGLRTAPNDVDRALVVDVLATLRKYSAFDELVEVGRAAMDAGYDTALIRRHLSQGLIDTGEITDAIDELEAARAAEADDDAHEIDGLLGRAYKQLYINARPRASQPRIHDLEAALTHYRTAFDADPKANYWHGINYIALRSHAEKVRAGDPKAHDKGVDEIAKSVLTTLEGDAGHWAAATEMEARLALGDWDAAYDACRRYVDHPDVDRFALQSTLRQMQELWLLDDDEAPGERLLPLLRGRLGLMPGGRILVTDAPGELGDLERVYGDTKYTPLEWLRDALRIALGVARICRVRTSGDGTGFLLEGAAVDEHFAGRNLLVTNAHVCSPDPSVRSSYGALAPEDVFVQFREAGEHELKGARVVFSSPPSELDVTVLELDEVPSDSPRAAPSDSILSAFPVVPEQRVTIPGHPHGGTMHIALQNNRVQEVGDPYFWYTAPTDPGMSGSPIFDEEWKLVGLHRAGRRSRKANEGVRIDRIVAALRESGARPSVIGLGATESSQPENAWDRAHDASAPADAYVEPEITQRVQLPPDDDEDSVGIESSGERRFDVLDDDWPPSQGEFRFGWHLGDEYSGLRSARERVGDPGAARIRVGILDTGYDPQHVSKPVHLAAGEARNFTGQGRRDDAVDRTESGFLHNPGHGTATLALLAGSRIQHPDLPGGEDWLGGAPHVEVVPIRVADSVVHFQSDALAKGIDYAVDIGCRVISISMGGVPTRKWAKAVNRAYRKGVVIVAAAGNRFGDLPPETIVYPARFHRVIAVCGATHGKRPYHRHGLHFEMHGCFGPKSRMKTAIAAYTPNMPWAAFDTGDAVAIDGAGTSSATPQVAAAAALWLQLHRPQPSADEPWRDVEAVRHALFSTADDSWRHSDRWFGAGLLRAHKALDVEWRGDLPKAPSAKVRFPWIRLLTGLERVDGELPPTQEMLEAEALQLYIDSVDLQEAAGHADPGDDLLDDEVRARVIGRLHRDERASAALRKHLEQLSSEGDDFDQG